MRKVVMLFVFSMFFLTCSAFSAFSQPVSTVEGIEVLTLPDSSAGVSDISARYSDRFRSVSGDVVRYRTPEETLWIRIPMAVLKEAMRSFSGRNAVLVLGNGYISRVEGFVPQREGGFRRGVDGVDVPAGERTGPSRFPTFRLESSDGEGYAWLKVQSNLPVSFSVFVQDEKDFYGMFVDRLAAEMAFYGFMAALTLTYLLFYLMTGDRDYFLAVLRQLAAFAFLLAFNGYLQYYFDAPPYAVYAAGWCFLGVHCVAGALFSSRRLQMDTERYVRWLAYFQACLGVLMTCCALAGYLLPSLYVVLVALGVEFLSSLAVGILRFRQGYRSILLFVFSRLAFIAGMVLLALDVFSPWSTDVPESVLMLCFLLDPVLLAGMLIPGTRKRLENYFSLEEKSIRYEKMSQRDGMTGLYNKAYLLSLLSDQIRAARRDGRELAFMMLDIDHFKNFNDTWGHPEGDRMLGFLSRVIRQSLRESDIAARYGGEEFSIILPGGTLPTSILVAERIRKTFEKESALLGDKKKTTVSVGLSFLTPNDTVTTLIQRADDALYRAKANGRNRTEFEVTA